MKQIIAALVLLVAVSGCATSQGSGLKLTIPARDGFDGNIGLDNKPQAGLDQKQ